MRHLVPGRGVRCPWERRLVIGSEEEIEPGTHRAAAPGAAAAGEEGEERNQRIGNGEGKREREESLAMIYENANL